MNPTTNNPDIIPSALAGADNWQELFEARVARYHEAGYTNASVDETLRGALMVATREGKFRSWASIYRKVFDPHFKSGLANQGMDITLEELAGYMLEDTDWMHEDDLINKMEAFKNLATRKGLIK